jgi:hypothetical protein
VIAAVAIRFTAKATAAKKHAMPCTIIISVVFFIMFPSVVGQALLGSLHVCQGHFLTVFSYTKFAAVPRKPAA